MVSFHTVTATFPLKLLFFLTDPKAEFSSHKNSTSFSKEIYKSTVPMKRLINFMYNSQNSLLPPSEQNKNIDK